ncbi:hypothetical protein HHI36_001789 [Cryptolaemus montrouzieri]|uniref:Uncharacterized protein n=1 Tax=Cryptolaemus montrouzieri TaxID=559131 RepID=A0ABD2P8H6_9CUCU
MDEKSSYVAITEHWYTNTEVECINLKGYRRLSAFARETLIHGCLSIFIEEGIVDVEEVKYVVQKSVEGIIEFSSVVNRKCKLIIIAIYRPPQGNDDVFYDILADVLDLRHNRFRNYKAVLLEKEQAKLDDTGYYEVTQKQEENIQKHEERASVKEGF